MVSNSSIGEEAGLVVSNDGGEMGFESIGKDFGDDLVDGITESYWSEVFETMSIRGLRYQIEQCGVDIRGNSGLVKHLFAKVNGQLTNNVLILLVEQRV